MTSLQPDPTSIAAVVRWVEQLDPLVSEITKLLEAYPALFAPVVVAGSGRSVSPADQQLAAVRRAQVLGVHLQQLSAAPPGVPEHATSLARAIGAGLDRFAAEWEAGHIERDPERCLRSVVHLLAAAAKGGELGTWFGEVRRLVEEYESSTR